MNWTLLFSDERIRKSNPTTDLTRNAFESDFGRIIFSPALRRMHDKTQVFPLTADDNIHSRLTHSNEVMSIGYTLGVKLCYNETIQAKTKKSSEELLRIIPLILKNICLIHDIGNAPFGHFGETIVSNYFKELEKKNNEFFGKLNDHQKRDFINYDGNAQGLRVLTKLQILDDAYGLNLTFATLAAYLKYPNFEEINDNVEKGLNEIGELLEDGTIEKSKHGVFESETTYFERIMKACDLKKEGRYLRHPLCYLMEAADSIAYLTMDMEDGFYKGLFNLVYVKNKFKKLNTKLGKYIIETCENKLLNKTSKIVNIRIALIDHLVNFTYNKFIQEVQGIENGSYNKEILKDDPDNVADILSKICFEKVFIAREINYLESTGHSVFTGLLNYYIEFLFHHDKKVRKRAKSLISNSIINCAIEENLEKIFKHKIPIKISKLEAGKISFKKHQSKIDSIQTEILKLTKDNERVEILLPEFIKLSKKQELNPIPNEEKTRLSKIKKELTKIVDPNFDDLDNYYKFRVILDFISGMTDQYALNHFQKISGQKIN